MPKYINVKTGQYPVPTKVVERYARHADKPNFVDPYIGKLEPVTEIPKPQADYKHIVKEGKPEFKDNVWVQTWIVEQISDQEAKEIFDKFASTARSKRDLLLKETDWTQLLDAPIDKNAWAKYRADLRSLPEQTEFPFSITWPIKP